MHGDTIKTYKLVRNKDVTGVSGTGIVGFIAELPSGRCVLEWISNHPTITIFNNIKEIELIHGHDGKSVIKCIEMQTKKIKKKVKK